MNKNIIIPADLDISKGHSFNAVSGKWEVNNEYINTLVGKKIKELLGVKKYILAPNSDYIAVKNPDQNYFKCMYGMAWLKFDFTFKKNTSWNIPIFTISSDAPINIGLEETTLENGVIIWLGGEDYKNGKYVKKVYSSYGSPTKGRCLDQLITEVKV